jgi:hypothetical protein
MMTLEIMIVMQSAEDNRQKGLKFFLFQGYAKYANPVVTPTSGWLQVP